MICIPTKCGQKDSKGYFCRWGSSGKKYYYTKGDKESMERARKKADKQGAAAHASGYQGAYDCECIDCGYKMQSDEHCMDIACPKCGGQMRRADRPGIGMSYEKASGVQSLRFDKKKFNRQQAISWAKSHGFKSGDVEEMSNEWRLRQFPPERCLKSGGMKELDTGVSGYICPTAETIKSKLDNISKLINIIKCNKCDK